MSNKIESTKKKSNFSEELQNQFDSVLKSKEIDAGAVLALNSKNNMVSYVVKGDDDEVKKMIHSTLILPDLLTSCFDKSKKAPDGKSVIGIPGWFLTELDILAEQSVKEQNGFSVKKTCEALSALSETFNRYAKNIQKYAKEEKEEK